jgi:hypothetical protein
MNLLPTDLLKIILKDCGVLESLRGRESVEPRKGDSERLILKFVCKRFNTLINVKIDRRRFIDLAIKSSSITVLRWMAVKCNIITDNRKNSAEYLFIEMRNIHTLIWLLQMQEGYL